MKKIRVILARKQRNLSWKIRPVLINTLEADKVMRFTSITCGIGLGFVLAGAF